MRMNHSGKRETKHSSVVAVTFLSTITLCHIVAADPPPGYYNTVNTTNASTLRSTLHAVIDDHTRYPYTSSATDTWDILEDADENPNNTNQILDVYKNAAYTKAGGGNNFYNREHSWPKSYGFPLDVSTNYPYTDCHLLFLGDSSYNSSRGNKLFRDCTSGCTEKTTNVNNGQGGGSGVYPGNSNWTSGSGATGTWEAWISRRGDLARALFYVDVRYEGGTHGITGAAEPNLILTNNTALIVSDTTQNKSVAYMGVLSELIEWHYADPIDNRERDRNDVVAAYQGNRNPFVDHPEWVACLFEGQCAPANVNPWINEFHYDNNGTDSNEFVEIAGVAGTNLSGWTLQGYNGSGGAVYATLNLSGTIPNTQGGRGVLGFNFADLQNGSPDGIALVNNSGQAIQFLSYEGAFTATNGPASGTLSTDVIVSETATTTVGFSLRLTGSGCEYSDFTWQAPAAHSKGSINSGQTLTTSCP